MRKYKFRYEDGVLYIRVTLISHSKKASYQFLVDTGASESVVSEKIAEELGYDLASIKEDRMAPPVATASDVVYPKKITLQTFVVLGMKKNTCLINVLNFPDDIAGVVGNDFLSEAKKITIYYPNEETKQKAIIEIG
jgi:predicted aspartyl protease